MRSRLTAVLFILLIVGLSSCGPHMVTQPSIRPYSRQMPPMPAKSIPTAGTLGRTTTQQTALAKNPVSPTRLNLQKGKVFYEYYCLMCHGRSGRGDGAVGVAYQPAASDLTSPKIKAMSDGQLYRSMLKGVGHDPVMEETVQPDERWPLVLYVRLLAKPGGKP